MSSVCPSGHDSSADDYCDVCGLPIDSSAATPADPGAPAGGGAEQVSAADTAATAPEEESADCPNCQAANPPDALFCEACGYDFTTGTMPRPVEPAPLDLSVFGIPDPSAPATPVGETGQAGQAGQAGTQDAPEPVAPRLEAAWVAEVWIDPDWYDEQDSDDPLPSAGVPEVVPIRTRSVLVGRASRSRGIDPDIELGSDTGISRRHCQLTTDGTRWWVEDLGSSNGTYVGGSIGALPAMPITPGEKREIAPDERLYLGAWTRIVVRRAQPGEI
ncbi:FHA domain-containing protein [Nocardioides sambongensis]|uniref:FHA domain-containing protein n=1 Tax=Nocardioides sambongensis TaxID=2589074 RepID=UPI001126CAC4|nr:FHA domain-containing protein [Nocardioides sambongensis]